MFKTIFSEPFIANGNTLAPIVLEQIIISVVTSVLHVGIGSIQRSAKRAMRCVCLNGFVVSVAPATLCVSAPKIITTNGNDIAAIAQTFPRDFSVAVSPVFSNNG